MTNKQQLLPEQELSWLKNHVKTLEIQLADQELKNCTYDNLFDHIPLAMLSLDAFGYIQLINRSFSNLFDYPKDKLNTRIHISRFLQFKGTLLGNKIAGLLDNHIQFDMETRIPELGDLTSFFRVRGISMTGVHEKAMAHLIIIGDITKRRKAEKNLRFAKEKAEEANMLKTAFLSNLSHEIRTPLNHILGFLELLLMGDIPTNEKEEYTSIVRSSSDILLKRIEDVIQISKIETRQMDVHKENIAVSDILERVCGEIKSIQNQQNKQYLEIITGQHIDHQNLVISGDVNKVHQILINFIENGLIFTQSGHIEIGYFIENKNGICFFVKDTGVGISAEYHESIFEHFRQVDNSPIREVGGSGLGLAIAKGMAKLMNGSITLDSKLGDGSTFYLHLPESIISIDPLINDNMANSIDCRWPGKKFIVADYELASFNLLKVMLSKTEANLSWVKTSDELIAELYEDQPDLIILDVDLPGIPLKEVMSVLKRKSKQVPLIIMGQELDSEEMKFLRSTMPDQLLNKPINKGKLLHLIEQFFEPKQLN